MLLPSPSTQTGWLCVKITLWARNSSSVLPYGADWGKIGWVRRMLYCKMEGKMFWILFLLSAPASESWAQVLLWGASPTSLFCFYNIMHGDLPLNSVACQSKILVKVSTDGRTDPQAIFPCHDQETFQGLPFPLFSQGAQVENQDNCTAKMLSISLLYLLFFMISFHSQVKECRLFEELICSGGALT